MSDFPKLREAARSILAMPGSSLNDADIVRIACSDCPFYKPGEDEDLECGAFRLLRHLLRRDVVTVQAILDAVRAAAPAPSDAAPSAEVQGAAAPPLTPPSALDPARAGPRMTIASHCALKRLETPALYDLRADALYELDEEGLALLASGPPAAAAAQSPEAAALLDFCRSEGLLVEASEPTPIAVPEAPPLLPSLRYLLVHLTDRCTLSCKHCFLGRRPGTDLTITDVLHLADEFAALQGLRFIVSGGEPMLHRHFWRLNERLPSYPFRSILLTNGTLLDREAARSLRFHEVQVSLDGPRQAHDLLRGVGSFARAVAALRHLAEAGVPISVASMVFSGNLESFDELAAQLEEFPLHGWSIDVPCPAGSLLKNPGLLPDLSRSAPLIARSFGGGFYGSSGEYACGAHLAAVMPDGTIDKCGYFTDLRSGSAREGLAAAWLRLPRWRIEELSCHCPHLAECRGGCRFRAQAHGDLLGPDPVLCHVRGVSPVGKMTAP